MDFALFKWELSDYDFSKLCVWVDSGFQGIKKSLKKASIRIPIKKRRGKERTETERKYNTEISRVRIRVEHAIGSMKSFAILQHRSRLKDTRKIMEITELCTGLSNFKKGFVNSGKYCGYQ